ncbi:MAG: hypothetical protein NTZ09_11190 [Candidatus Hydrogenedentes bacterium]|nr:hypothetical protein [Candidatus Hydrogenedentota bacterium]
MTKPTANLALAAVIMAYGWGYRGTVGHEAGAMVPGALLGLAVALGSGRPDWQRRAAVAGLFGAIGWAWGGCLSYMEHTSYVLSDSFPNVLYGYAILFFLGGLWAGIGGGVLGLALTEPRSELERLIRPFTAIAAAFFVAYLCFLFNPDLAEAYETLSVRQFHDGEWLAATIALVVSGAYWLARPKDRRATALFFWGALAWWIGYGALTKLGGLRLAPLHRSESWGGVLGMLAVLMIYLARRHNRAALMLCLYGIVGGGFGFSLAVFLRAPIQLHLWPFTGDWPQWRVAEVLFGLFMGLAIALGCRRLIRGGIESVVEDTPPAPLDAYAVFVMLVALPWMNFRRHAAPWIDQYDAMPAPWLGVPGWAWFVLGGSALTLPVLYVLYGYLRGVRRFVPASAYGKGAGVAVVLVWLTVAGYSAHDVPSRANFAGYLLLWAPAVIATLLLIQARHAQGQSIGDGVGRSAGAWRVGRGYAIACAIAPVFLIAITALGMAIQDGPPEGLGRKRFGPDAYWRQTARLLGVWHVVGVAETAGGEPVEPQNARVARLEFKPNRDVTATMPSGEVVETHQWFLKNQYTWLHWYGKIEKHPEKSELPLEFRNTRLYIALPSPNGAYTVFERTE